MSEPEKKSYSTLYTLFIALVIATVAWQSIGPLPLRDLEQSKIFALLSSLLVVALFLERALEVYITTSRSGKAIDLEYQLGSKQEALDKLTQLQAPPEDIERAVAEVRDLSEQRVRYKAETRKISMWAGLAFGILISAVGIRTLGSLVTVDAYAVLGPFQKGFFDLVDVCITGGLLAGGSDSLHQLTNIYTNYMEMLSRRAKGEA